MQSDLHRKGHIRQLAEELQVSFTAKLPTIMGGSTLAEDLQELGDRDLQIHISELVELEQELCMLEKPVQQIIENGPLLKELYCDQLRANLYIPQ
jgi:hypothetical protein